MTNAEFIKWESDTFGYGYGTGEAHTLPALKTFLELCGKQPHFTDSTNYNYEELEKAITPLGTWLLINILAHADIVEYGTSPRFGWLTSKGEELRDFVCFHSVKELCDLIFKPS